jgi:hypothetical protein
MSQRCQSGNRLVKNESAHVSYFVNRRVSPRQDGGMGRRSERNLDNSLKEAHTPRCQFVNMKRGDALRAIAGEVVCPQRVQRDQEDIGIPRLAFPHLRCLDAVRATRTAGRKQGDQKRPDHPALYEGQVRNVTSTQRHVEFFGFSNLISGGRPSCPRQGIPPKRGRHASGRRMPRPQGRVCSSGPPQPGL